MAREKWRNWWGVWLRDAEREWRRPLPPALLEVEVGWVIRSRWLAECGEALSVERRWGTRRRMPEGSEWLGVERRWKRREAARQAKQMLR